LALTYFRGLLRVPWLPVQLNLRRSHSSLGYRSPMEYEESTV
jgi:transposase InsO family protein